MNYISNATNYFSFKSSRSAGFEDAGNTSKRCDFDWMTIIRNNKNEVLTSVIQESIPKGINARLSDGTYPLHAAVRLVHPEMVSTLIQAGANPELKDFQGLTAYDYAILSENTEILKALLPEEAVGVLGKALKQADTTFFQRGVIQDRALQLVSNLRQLVQSRTAVSRDEIRGLHGLFLRGDIEAIALLGEVDVSRNQRSKNALTPLHCALLSKNESVVSIVLGQVDDDDFFAKDDKGLTPLHYGCMLGLSESLEAMLARCKGNSKFDINEVHPRLQYSLANLAIAANQPKIFTILCQNGTKINGEGAECCPADLLCALVKDRDPLKISTAQYILAGFNVLSLVTDQISPQASVALMLCSVLSNAALSQKGGLRGQALYWGGEAFSLAVRTGLAQVPLIKAGVDIYRVASVTRPCLNAVSRSFNNMRYETGKAIRCSTVNSVIVGSSIYRIRDSIRYALRVVSQIPHYVDSVLTISGREDYLSFKEGFLQKKETKLISRESFLQRKEIELSSKESFLSRQERELSSKRKELIRIESELERQQQQGVLSKIAGLFSSKDLPERHITFGTTYHSGNKYRDALSKLVNDNQKECAERWGMTHRVVDWSLLKNQCTVKGELRDCSPYWNKIKVLKDWLDDTTTSRNGKEEWYIIVDDDMPVTNMKIDPYLAIDELRGGQDTSVIVTKDVIPYTGNPITSVNTGLLFVRKDDAGRELIDQIWEKRNIPLPRAKTYCPTLGVCAKQHTLHEQQAMADLIGEQPGIIDRVLSIVSVRDTYSSERGHIALNSFERSGRFTRQLPNWESDCFDFEGDSYHPDGKWQPGDWMGQATGVPEYGRYCSDKSLSSPPEPIRLNKVKNMLKQVTR